MVFARENSDGLTSLVKGLNKATDNKSLNSFVCFLSDDEGLEGKLKELAEKEGREAAVLETFLPQPLPADELEQLVRATIQEMAATSKKDMGPVIKAVQAKAAGRADGKSISTVVGRLLP